MSQQHPSYASLTDLKEFRFSQVERAWNSVCLVATVDIFIAKLALMNGGAHMQPNLRALEEGPLTVNVREICYDLVAVTCSNRMPSDHGLNTMLRFYASVMAIILKYKDQKSVVDCLNAILQKLHRTTYVLRRLSPTEDSLFEVQKLHRTVVQLLSYALPRSFFLVYRRLPDHNKLLHIQYRQKVMQIRN
ncbi:hypothetical protein DL96DRAFT_1720781 [Flagelloscypha sp. PMI_526]|nr:hypothetical protein DL96DRAFT_1720781 [Flagelloscypha sp. PMI_526]